MNTTTIFMPVSRKDYLDRVFHSLEILDCDKSKTNLLVIVDGDSTLYVNTRNRVEQSKFFQRLCVPYKNNKKLKNYDLKNRRLRISDIHNESKKYIIDCDYILGLEDDTIIPANTLRKLLQDYMIYPYAGFIQGVELGRWGIPYVGAWKIDDVYNPSRIESLSVSEGVQEIDSGGFYCYLTTRDNYMMNFYEPFGNNELGPDVDFGIKLRQQGFLNYIDWSIKCVHKNEEADISLSNTEPRQLTIIKKNNEWRHSNRA